MNYCTLNIHFQKKKININKKTGIPEGVFNSDKLTAKAVNDLNEQNNVHNIGGPGSVGGRSAISRLSIISNRAKDESLEEKRERKKNVKEYQKERRIEKKLNRQAFREETARQMKIKINNKNNVQGNKIL